MCLSIKFYRVAHNYYLVEPSSLSPHVYGMEFFLKKFRIKTKAFWCHIPCGDGRKSPIYSLSWWAKVRKLKFMLANEIALKIYGFVDIIIGSFLQTFKK